MFGLPSETLGTCKDSARMHNLLLPFARDIEKLQAVFTHHLHPNPSSQQHRGGEGKSDDHTTSATTRSRGNSNASAPHGGGKQASYSDFAALLSVHGRGVLLPSAPPPAIKKEKELSLVEFLDAVEEDMQDDTAAAAQQQQQQNEGKHATSVVRTIADFARSLETVNTLQRHLQQALQVYKQSCRAQVAHIHQAQAKLTAYLAYKAKYDTKLKAYLSTSKSSHSQAKQQKQDRKMKIRKQYLTMQLFDVHSTIRNLMATRKLFLVKALLRVLEAHRTFFTKGAEIMNTIIPQINDLGAFVKTQSSLTEQRQGKVRAMREHWERSTGTSFAMTEDQFVKAMASDTQLLLDEEEEEDNVLVNAPPQPSSAALGRRSSARNASSKARRSSRPRRDTSGAADHVRDNADSTRLHPKAAGSQHESFLYFPVPHFARVWCTCKEGVLTVMQEQRQRRRGRGAAVAVSSSGNGAVGNDTAAAADRKGNAGGSTADVALSEEAALESLPEDALGKGAAPPMKFEKPITLPLLLCTAKAIDGKDKLRFVFTVISPQRSVVLQADSEEQRQYWLDILHNAIESEIKAQDGRGSEHQQSARIGPVAAGSARSPRPGPGGGNGAAKGDGGLRVPRSSLIPTNSGPVPALTAAEKELFLSSLRALAGNDRCADCGAPNPDWVSKNLAVLVCTPCSGIHRSLGVHISRIQSLSLDDMDRFLLRYLLVVGNARANNIYEKSLLPGAAGNIEADSDGDDGASVVQEPTLAAEEAVADVVAAQGSPKSAQSARDAAKRNIMRATPDCVSKVREEWIRAKYVKRAFVDSPSKDPLELATILFDAIALNKPVAMLQALAWGANPKRPLAGEEGRTALHEAAMYGDVVCTEMICQNTDRLTAKEKRGWTVLHYAAYQDDVEIVQLLLMRGGKQLMAEKDKEGRTPREACVAYNKGRDMECLKVLDSAVAQLRTRSAYRL